ncbi:acyl-CoA thioesterase [Roseovarius sp. MMSF_3281]|uniref:acyl-CoA thioesterase n=1 Tax=Roseovarius sp. MMSF_3281 TaxID=3046694 RepID=UPI00273FDFB3|nr:acyl-CoA thioesterase [Roseovarius sp. MMSF_3281]
MYPVIRLIWQMFKHRKDAPLGVTDTHVSRHMCLPWDIDLWMELNNGRTLTLFDMGRIPLAQRVGLIAALKRRKWGLTVAGVSVRYRRRIRMFETVEMQSRAVWWDDRFVYIEQSMWKASGECANHILLRTAVTGKSGIVPPNEVMAEVGQNLTRPDAPEWVNAWIDADTKRPWPPMQE